MRPFTSILFIDNCPVEYRVRNHEGTDMLIFIPVQVENICEIAPIFYVAQKEEGWTVLNVKDENLVTQVLDQIGTMYGKEVI